jgi:hypothetical protein
MPQALAATAFTVGGTAITYGAILQFSLAVGSVAYSRQQSKKAKRALKRLSDLASEAQERKLTATDPVAPRRIIYGEVEVGGTIIFRHVNGANNEYRHLIIIFADHPVESVSHLKFDGELVPLVDNIATGRFAGHVLTYFFNGTQTSIPVAEDFCPEVWTSNHQLRGMAGMYIRLKYNPNLFPNSIPQITARCRGKKVYDPRTALTTWSNNAALCLADFMCDTKLGMGFDFFSEINIPELIASANNCDELVPLSA